MPGLDLSPLSATEPSDASDAGDGAAIFRALYGKLQAQVTRFTEGLFADRPSPTLHGHVYLATDVDGGTFYQATGSAWRTYANAADLASLAATVSSKQDASTAATDAELTAAVSALTAAINAKQDAATAATDAELAAAVASLTTAINAKQDASTAATDAELTAALTPESWHAVGSGGGEPGFSSYWSSLSQPLKFFKDPSGIVHLKGGVTNPGTDAATPILFTLPAGYRPDATRYFAPYRAAGGGTNPYVTVESNGRVSIQPYSSGQQVYLDVVSFRAEA